MPFYSVDSKYQQRANRRTGYPGRLFASLGVGLYIPCLCDCYVTPSQVLSLSHSINRKNICAPVNMSLAIMEREHFLWLHSTGA